MSAKVAYFTKENKILLNQSNRRNNDRIKRKKEYCIYLCR